MATNTIPALLFAAAAPADKTGPAAAPNTTTTNTSIKDIFVTSTNKVIAPSSREVLTNRFYYLTADQKELALNFDKYATNRTQNLSLIIGTAEKHDLAFEWGLGVWFNDKQNPTLYELANDENIFLTRHKQFISKYGANKVSTLQWSFHGQEEGQGLIFTDKADPKPEEIFDYNDKELRAKLVEVLPSLLKKDGATLILDSCGNNYLDQTFIEFIQSLLEETVTKSDLQNIRFFASRIPLSPRGTSMQLKQGKVEALKFNRPASTVDITIKKNADGKTEAIDNKPINLSTYPDLLKEFRAERVMLEKSFAAYKAKLEAVTSAVEKPSKDTLVTLQNDFVYHANTLSTHCSLFARSISKLNSDDSKTTDAALKQLVKELAGDILGIRKLVSHEGQIAYAKNYGLGDHPPVY